jgi:hypothetical protein
VAHIPPFVSCSLGTQRVETWQCISLGDLERPPLLRMKGVDEIIHRQTGIIRVDGDAGMCAGHVCVGQ